jgi:HK97 family phage major capsid protein
MDELQKILAELNSKLGTPAPTAPAAEAATPAAETTPVVEATASTKSEKTAKVKTPKGVSRKEFSGTMGEVTTSMKTLAEAVAALRAPGTSGRTHDFETGSVAPTQAGGPAYLRLTSDIKSNPSVHKWIVALGLKALGRTSMDLVDTIRYELDQKALAEGNLAVVSNTGADLGTGGALAPVQLNQQIIDYLWPNVIVRKAGAEQWNLTAAEMIMPRILNPSGSNFGQDPAMNPLPAFTSEAAVIPATTMAFGQRTLRPQELAVIVAVSRQLVVDSDPTVEAVLRNALVQSIAAIEDRNFLIGSGTSPVIKGLLKYTNATDGCVQVSKGTNGGALTYDDLVNMITSLMGNGVPMNKACWLMNPLLFGGIRKLKDNQGRPLMVDYMDIQQGSLSGANSIVRVPSMFGFPVFMSQQIPTNDTQGTASNATKLALLDMDYVKIGQRGTLEITTSTDASYVDNGGSSEQSAFIRNQILFRAIERVDITMTAPQALSILYGITGY